MNTIKIDESIVLLSEVNIKTAIKKIRKKLHIRMPKEEIEYYMDNTIVNKISKSLVFYYYAKYFGGFNDLKHITLKQYMQLMVLMKQQLIMMGNVYLPMIISANVVGHVSNRMIHNTKFIDDVESSSVYETLSEDKFDTIVDMGRADLILNPLSILVNTQFTCVEYSAPELLGRPIEIDNYVLSQEFLDFIDKI
jgi:hypothetical protein